jgi:enoyl-CoA hydratase/carnithine racemase
MSDFIRLETFGEVARMTLARPEKLNAINDEMLMAMLECLRRVAGAPQVRVLVVTGEGRAFSAGGDIASMEGLDEAGFRETIQLYMRLGAAFRDLDEITIAAVNGYALAGGFELALLCDIRIGSSSAVFGLPDAALGLSPTSGMTWLLPRIIGYGRAMYLTLSGDRFGAPEAERIGLVSSVVEDTVLEDSVMELASKIAACPGPVAARTKAGFRGALEQDYVSATRFEELAEMDCFRSGETQKAFAEFLARKKG